MIDVLNKYLKNIDVSDLENGFVREADTYVCLFCGNEFETGIVYPVQDTLYTARRAVQQHIAGTHGDVIENLLGLGKDITGISSVQETVLRCLHAGLSDKQIARKMGGKSVSTVRNQRFHLRKRRTEAKLFLAIMGLLDKDHSNEGGFVEFNTSLAVQDERTIVTLEEQRQILKTYFEPGSSLSLLSFPRKQKVKLVILNRISELFQRNRTYTELEVNTILGGVCADHVTIRRYLIDYGFLDRKADGSSYWLK